MLRGCLSERVDADDADQVGVIVCESDKSVMVLDGAGLDFVKINGKMELTVSMSGVK